MSREQLAENLIKILPMIHKKLINPLGVCGATKQQFELLHFLHYQEGKPMSYYGEKLGISKPNLTVVADKMIEEGFIERDYSKEDRRVIILTITQKGRDYLRWQKQEFKTEIAKRLESLGTDDMIELESSLNNIAKILNKIE